MIKKIKTVLFIFLLLFLNVSVVYSNNNDKKEEYIIDSYDIDVGKEYDVKTNSDGTKTYILYPSYNKIIDKKNMYLQSCGVDVNKYYPINDISREYAYDGIEEAKLVVYEKAKALGFGSLQEKMNDYANYPYTVCDYYKYSKDELKSINMQLKAIYDELKETDVGSACGFALDSVKANIISSEKAIKSYSDSIYDNYKKLDYYIENKNQNKNIFNLGKNIVNIILSKEGYKKQYPAQSIIEIKNIRDSRNDLYYDAELIYNQPVIIPREIINNIKIDDKILIYICDNKDINTTEPLKLVYKRKTVDGYGFSELIKKDNEKYKTIYGVFKTPKEADEDYYKDNDYSVWDRQYENTDEKYPCFYHVEELEGKYYIDRIANEYDEVYEYEIHKVLYKTKMPIRILKDARVMGTYWFSNLDSYFSDTFRFDSWSSRYIRDIKKVYLDNDNHNKEVLLKDIYKKNIICFTYKEWQKSQFYLPLTFEEYVLADKDNKDELKDKNIKPLTRFTYIDGLAYDEKGYITAIYKGKSSIYVDDYE